MCTVTFIPTHDGYLFSSNRDESPLRQKALPPLEYEEEGTVYVCPIDPQGGGTWVGINCYNNVVILLNGAFGKHKWEGPYRKSRGAIVKELLKGAMPVAEWNLMSLDGIEPFTLVVFSDKCLYELVWDGSKKHRLQHDEKKGMIWSSSTLYEERAKTDRKQKFDRWLTTSENPSSEDLFRFLLSYKENENGFIMNRGAVSTLSLTTMKVKGGKADFAYREINDGEPQSPVFINFDSGHHYC
jgi:hypothetical protein